MNDARNDPEDLTEEELGALLRDLKEPPRAWIDAAKELPAARAEIDGIVARAEADAAFREEVLADLEEALRAEGQEPSPQLVAALKARLEA
ncbi:MAG: hypothetical protein U0R24_14910 [Solirubrobacterales bacterium]